ncbi:LuxR C-terminal-related transcriptional regulator [Burkholderia contaminans]|uniref:response regulator transcription factor n=1 Tax=Burkholderia contaminans TaxID=488447 RepID=UPI001CF4F596|nr:LuxR C-terminal-related transcriptional regulator [Burkholderia contaminans]MCA7889450.1 LuxR C-terminal-related transcriptional regulator [Burkholderia contaminans]
MRYHLNDDCKDFAKRTIAFSQTLLESSAAIFTWIDATQKIPPCTEHGLGGVMIRDYYRDFREFDPISPDFLLSNRSSVVTLRKIADNRFRDCHIPYAQFMARYGFVDEAAFVFWQDNRAIAFLNVLKGRHDKTLDNESVLQEMHSYIQYNLLGLDSIKTHRRNRKLTEHHLLTARELAIANLIASGLSNKEICHECHIELVTVKTHVGRVLAKLGLNTRSQVASFLHSITAD